ncbi:MAG: hypothetical protein P8163_10190 [Candidatus Thiodiazotropha sp.]
MSPVVGIQHQGRAVGATRPRWTAIIRNLQREINSGRLMAFMSDFDELLLKAGCLEESGECRSRIPLHSIQATDWIKGSGIRVVVNHQDL